MIFLNREDILKAVTRAELMDSIEEAFAIIHRGDFFMPDRVSVLHKNKNLLFMPCFTEDALGAKMLSVFPENAGTDKPVIHGLMVLNDQENGEISALIDGQALTALRTGAVGGVAMRSLAPPDTQSLGVIGAGVQGFMQILYACDVRDIKKICLYDAYRRDYAAYTAALRRELGPDKEIKVCACAKELLAQSSLVVTATNSGSPVLPDDPAALSGKTYIAIGSYMPDMRELPDALWQVAQNVYTELPFACEESGDLSQPLMRGLLTPERVIYMGDHLAQNIPPAALKEDEARCFKSVGVGLFDLVCAKAIYTKARELKIGRELN